MITFLSYISPDLWLRELHLGLISRYPHRPQPAARVSTPLYSLCVVSHSLSLSCKSSGVWPPGKHHLTPRLNKGTGWFAVLSVWVGLSRRKARNICMLIGVHLSWCLSTLGKLRMSLRKCLQVCWATLLCGGFCQIGLGRVGNWGSKMGMWWNSTTVFQEKQSSLLGAGNVAA